MRKAFVLASAVTVLVAMSGIATVDAAQKSGQSMTRAEKRGKCMTEARGWSDKGRGWRSRYRACMARR
jgi:hypothetical protein